MRTFRATFEPYSRSRASNTSPKAPWPSCSRSSNRRVPSKRRKSSTDGARATLARKVSISSCKPRHFNTLPAVRARRRGRWAPKRHQTGTRPSGALLAYRPRRSHTARPPRRSRRALAPHRTAYLRETIKNRGHLLGRAPGAETSSGSGLATMREFQRHDQTRFTLHSQHLGIMSSVPGSSYAPAATDDPESQRASIEPMQEAC